VVFSGGAGKFTKDLEMRLQSALSLYLLEDAVLLLVGGQYHRAWDGRDSVAAAMGQWLIDKGVPSEKVFVRAASVHTIENVVEDVLPFVEEYQPKMVYFVSFTQQLKRAELTIEYNLGYSTVGLDYYSSGWVPEFKTRVKEYLLYLWTKHRDRTGEGRVWRWVARRRRKNRLAELARLERLEIL